MTDHFEQRPELPSPTEYAALRVSCGMSSRSVEAATIGLRNSLFCTTIRDNGKLIAMARVVGDGGCNFEIVDVAVDPANQRQGLGTRVMAAVMDYIKAAALPSAYVCLIADDHSPRLYEKFGFRPTAPASISMALCRD